MTHLGKWDLNAQRYFWMAYLIDERVVAQYAKIYKE